MQRSIIPANETKSMQQMETIYLEDFYVDIQELLDNFKISNDL